MKHEQSNFSVSIEQCEGKGNYIAKEESDQVTVDFPFGRRAKPSLIHIHKYHDLSNGVVIFCVMGKKEERKKAEG